MQKINNGINLDELVKQQGVFYENQVWQLLKELLPLIKCSHSQNLIHGDIQPGNIIFSTVDKNFALVNFATGIVSPEYAAPELIKGKPVFSSDLYSLGVTCIHLLTQISPFDLFDAASDRWIWQSYLNAKISTRLAQILDKLVENDLSRRFQSADEVMQVMGIQDNFCLVTIPSSPWRCLATLTEPPAHSAAVNSIAISPDGHTLASGYDNKTIKLWDLNTKQIRVTLSAHSQAVKSVAFSSNGKILATASDDKTIKLWNVDTQEEIYTLLGHSQAIKSVAFSPDGELLASGSWDKTIKIWQVNSGEEIYTLTGHQLQVTNVAFSPCTKNLVASTSFDRTVRLWQLPSAFDGENPQKIKNRPLYTLWGHAWAVLTAAFSPDGKILATGSDDNTIKVWEVSTGQLITTLNSHSWSVASVAFSADGETLISGSKDKTVKLWRVRTMEEIATFNGHVDSVSSIAVNSEIQQKENLHSNSSTSQLIISGSRDKTIKLWEFVQQQD